MRTLKEDFDQSYWKAIEKAGVVDASKNSIDDDAKNVAEQNNAGLLDKNAGLALEELKVFVNKHSSQAELSLNSKVFSANAINAHVILTEFLTQGANSKDYRKRSALLGEIRFKAGVDFSGTLLKSIREATSMHALQLLVNYFVSHHVPKEAHKNKQVMDNLLGALKDNQLLKQEHYLKKFHQSAACNRTHLSNSGPQILSALLSSEQLQFSQSQNQNRLFVGAGVVKDKAVQADMVSDQVVSSPIKK